MSLPVGIIWRISVACFWVKELGGKDFRKDDKLKGFSLPYKIAPYKVQIIYNENNKDKAEELYKELTDNNINAIIDDRENLTIGNRINDVYVLGTPKMIILGNKFDKENYCIENTKDNTTDTVKIKEIVNYFKNI